MQPGCCRASDQAKGAVKMMKVQCTMLMHIQLLFLELMSMQELRIGFILGLATACQNNQENMESLSYRALRYLQMYWHATELVCLT